VKWVYQHAEVLGSSDVSLLGSSGNRGRSPEELYRLDSKGDIRSLWNQNLILALILGWVLGWEYSWLGVDSLARMS